MKNKLKITLICAAIGGVLYCFYDGYIKMKESVVVNDKSLSYVPDSVDEDAILKATNEDKKIDPINEQVNKEGEALQKTNRLGNDKRTWEKLAHRVANGGEIIGVWEIYHPCYTMIYKLNRCYYCVGFDVSSGMVDETFELKKINKNTFKHIDNEEELIVIKGDELISYMDNPFEGGRFEASSYTKAK